MEDSLLKGELKMLLDAVKQDDTLDLELRGDSVNIYYRGGSIFKIKETPNGYTLFFDTKYCETHEFHSVTHKLSASPSVAESVQNLPFYKQCMDWYFHEHHEYEREFQQVIARENNNHGKISNATDYFIVDIEYVDNNNEVKDKSRFDMVAVKWLSESAVRKNSTKISLALIEVKYGDGAIKGGAGIKAHFEKMKGFLADKAKVQALCEDMSEVFMQKCRLGLVDKLIETQYAKVKINSEEPEIIFIFADHDPASKQLSQEVREAGPCLDHVFVANASHMGYGLYAENMRPLKEYVIE